MNKNKLIHSKVSLLASILYLLFLIIEAIPVYSQTPLTTTPVATGLSLPLFVTSPPGDTHRVFIVEQGGRIRIVKNGSLLAGDFLNLQNKVSCCGERGLLGLAFHPDYENNGYFYVNYTNTSGNTVIARFQVTANPDSADTASQQILLTVNQPFSNHNGGWLGFGPNDGYLYIGLGDGGSGGDPQNNAQNKLSLLGKILRIDIDTTEGYKIPPTNPFAESIGTLKEIWALGLRNPWRNSFDRATGNLYIADVGQSSWEELNFQPASSSGGENYGWRLKEGDHCYNPPSNCDTLIGLTDPIHEYPHSDGCSITGGYVYRGCAIPDLQGSYFFGDYCSGRIWSLRFDGNNITDFQERTSELGITVNISSFGEDATGELYIVGRNNGTVYRIVPDSAIPNCQGCLALSGDVTADRNVFIGDLIALINHIFKRQPPPEPLCRGDVTADGKISPADLVYLINYLFKGGVTPLKSGVCCL